MSAKDRKREGGIVLATRDQRGSQFGSSAIHLPGYGIVIIIGAEPTCEAPYARTIGPVPVLPTRD